METVGIILLPMSPLKTALESKPLAIHAAPSAQNTLKHRPKIWAIAGEYAGMGCCKTTSSFEKSCIEIRKRTCDCCSFFHLFLLHM